MGRGISNNERDFVIEALNEGQRLDSRGSETYRKIHLTPGPRCGHVEARIGRTRAIVDVTAELARPAPKRPNEGKIRFDVDLISAPSVGLNEIRLLNMALKRTNCVDTEALCIIPGERVFVVNVAVNVIDQDGNIFDCASLGVIAALNHFRYPQVSINDNIITVHSPDEKPYIPLVIYNFPFMISFAIINDHMCLIDPTTLEELVSENILTFSITREKKICFMLKAGKAPIDPDVIHKCSEIAISKFQEINDIFEAEMCDESKGL